MGKEIYRTGLGQDSHRFLSGASSKLCVLGGIVFEEELGLASESDGDVVFHAICNAITSLTGIPILSGVVIDLCKKDGITDSAVYVRYALDTLKDKKIVHVALSIEAQRPKLQRRIDAMRGNIAKVLGIQTAQVGITVISGEGLTDFGCGEGIQCLCLLTTSEEL